MSIAFIPIQTNQECFNNQTVADKWTQFISGVTNQINDTMKLNCSADSIQSILQETLEEHYSSKPQPNTTQTKSEKKKQERTQCQTILTNNKQCPNKAKIGNTVCTRHSK